MRRYFVDIPQRQKENLIQAADHAIGGENLNRELGIGTESKLLWKHRNGTRDNISVQLADDLLQLLEERPGGISDEQLRKNAERLDKQDQQYSPFDTDYREWLLKPYSNGKLAELSGKAESTCKEYRHNRERKLPNDLLVDLHLDKAEILAFPELEASIGKHGQRQEELVHKADREDVAFYSFMEQDLDEYSSRSDDILYMLDELIGMMEEGKEGLVGAGSDVTSSFCQDLASNGILSQSAESIYAAERDAEYLRTVRGEIANKLD